jgi:hypothetical protein
MLEQIQDQMNVNDRVQVDKLMLVQDFERFYLLQTINKFKKKRKDHSFVLTPNRFRYV